MPWDLDERMPLFLIERLPDYWAIKAEVKREKQRQG